MTAPLDYEKVYREFSWEKCMNEYLDWPKHGYFNIVHEAIDRHADNPKKVAIFYISADGREEKYTFREMRNLTSKHANMLRKLGLKKGDSVARMLPRCIENYITFMGNWKAGAVDIPVFTAYGPEALAYRAMNSKVKVLITDADNRPKVDQIAGGLPEVKIVVVSGPNREGLQDGDYDYWAEPGVGALYFRNHRHSQGRYGQSKGCPVYDPLFDVFA